MRRVKVVNEGFVDIVVNRLYFVDVPDDFDIENESNQGLIEDMSDGDYLDANDDNYEPDEVQKDGDTKIEWADDDDDNLSAFEFEGDYIVSKNIKG